MEFGKYDRELHEETLSSEEAYRGLFLRIARDSARGPDGSVLSREYVRHPGAVVVVALRDDGRMIVEHQFRYPLGRVFVEFPAGKIDPGEDLLSCARRELLEETGFSAGEWTHLGVMHPCIGYSDERIEIFLARELEPGPRQLDHGEFLELDAITPAEFEWAVRAGEITDGKSITAYFMAQPHLR